ncbi:eukaryotic rRNA processing [Lentinus tigrinus ALCF2SS1-7]|uniref:Eukaryotic rRNA processing n=1 Tax=Lentinus tigrinus ALCF2SS1-6 TaxID=1328759 RepID=A0A5C2SHM5_9APHY|nr:eukaryotic rRNA processing [Lentinus tigrinus ALCF2SS1-6]RPD77633.1 eukaryotic rRNA processing [Lentinus tigrinus ALCF2SS1-7]
MAKLMKALGEDGLDELAQEQLRALEDSEEEGSDEDEDDEEVGEASGDEDEGVEDADEAEGSDEEEADPAAQAGPSEEVAIPMDELSDEEMLDEDAMPRQKVEIDNKIALERIRSTIALDPSLPWTETLTVSYPEAIDVDIDDDLNRELAFYKQALHGAQTARSLAQKHNFPFTRPADYFAEMVKSDSHMERIRQRLLDESAGLKRSEEKRKEREGKKFGKQVQLEKIKERQQNKKEIEERLKGLKRKRKGAMDGADDGEDFDVAVEDALADRPSKRAKGPNGKSKLPRTARDKKFGFGGAGRRSKQNTKDSTDSFVQRGGPGGKKGGKGGKGAKAAPKRPGKSKRMAQRSRT